MDEGKLIISKSNIGKNEKPFIKNLLFWYYFLISKMFHDFKKIFLYNNYNLFFKSIKSIQPFIIVLGIKKNIKRLRKMNGSSFIWNIVLDAVYVIELLVFS